MQHYCLGSNKLIDGIVQNLQKIIEINNFICMGN